MNDELREALAAYAHDAWSRWMQYRMIRCRPLHSYIEHFPIDSQPDVSLVIPSTYVWRWTGQSMTEYGDLSESEKEGDRQEADRIMAIFESIIATERRATLSMIGHHKEEFDQLQETLDELRRQLDAYKKMEARSENADR